MNRLRSIICAPFIGLIKLYKKYLSHLKPRPTCRFTPTCSTYALEALKEWGLVCGTALTLWRIVRCNPFVKGGYDPVPLRRRHRGDTEEREDAETVSDGDGNETGALSPDDGTPEKKRSDDSIKHPKRKRNE